jgi:glucosamine-6-phosphate deaminase
VRDLINLQMTKYFLPIASVLAYSFFMTHRDRLQDFRVGAAHVHIFESRESLGMAAALEAASVINSAVKEKGHARVMAATGNSQLDVIAALTRVKDIPWDRVEVFHMDEYVGLSETHPASFRYWIKTRLADQVHPGQVHYFAGDAPDLDAEIDRYARLVSAGPLDLAFVGFGENGHIAFNDPHVADFDDPLIFKRVTLDDASRQQQAGEGHFTDAASVPKEAVTVTCPVLFHAAAWVSCVPELRKAEAVKRAFEGPISTACPASIVRKHSNAHVFLDKDSASLLSSASQVLNPEVLT